MAAVASEQVTIIEEVLAFLTLNPPGLAPEPEFRVRHADHRGTIDELLSRRLLERVQGYYIPTLAGLRAAGTAGAIGAITRCNALLAWLKERIRKDPRKSSWTAAELAEGSTFGTDDVRVFLTIILASGEYRIATAWSSSSNTPLTDRVQLSLDGVLDAQPFLEREPPDTTDISGPAFVRRLYVHNFRTFVNFEWQPPAACVLVGDNGAGKSALLEVLWLLQEVVIDGRTIDETAALSARTSWLAEPEQVFEIDIGHPGREFRYRLTVLHERGKAAIKEELHGAGGLLYRAESGRVELFGDAPSPAPRTNIPFDRKRSFIAALEPRYDNRQISAFREQIASIWAMKPDACGISGSASAESRFLLRDLSNFASWYLAKVTEDLDAATLLRSDLMGAIKGFSTLRFEPVSADVKDLRVRFAFGNTSYELPWPKLSDGQRLLIALYGLLRFGLPKASLIALDEAENYVAPAEIQPWLRAVADAASERKQQLIVVSHHPESINYLAADAVQRLWRDPASGHTRAAPLVPDMESGETAYEAFKVEAQTERDGSSRNG